MDLGALGTIAVVALIVAVSGVILFLVAGRGRQISGTSLLSLYSRDLRKLAEKGLLDPVIGREREIKRVIQILGRRTKNNPVLIGESGVGKTAIAEELGNLLAAGNVPEQIKDKRLLQLDLSSLLAGTKYRGEFEKRLKGIMDEMIAAERTIILFIDELQTLAEAGEASGALDAADILKPALARGELQVIGATTRRNYEQHILKDKTLERRFQPVTVSEPNEKETIAILEGIRPVYERHHRVRITDEAISEAVRMGKKVLTERCFPDKAIDLIDEAASKVHIAAMQKPSRSKKITSKVTKDDIDQIINDWTGDVVLYNNPDLDPPQG